MPGEYLIGRIENGFGGKQARMYDRDVEKAYTV